MENIIYNGNDNEDTMLDDIKAGKIYVTSSDGKHIYKRIYDASKSCKYVDEYQCTVTNFSLPKNAVLTKDGNYLYENSKKICALPDVLKKVEYRINQLNRIIDGAENALDNDVISKNRKKNIVNDTEDIIEEYLAVARGEKALSKVSEVKAIYVAETGDKNNTVEKIQQKLLNLGYTSQKVTGYYGDVTFNNVAYFQIINGLDVTGWVDSDTYEELKEKASNVSEEYFECEDETFTNFDIDSLEIPESEYINIIVELLGGKELLNEIGQQILDSMPEVTQEDINHLAAGIVSSVDDNILFGAGKKGLSLLGKVANLPHVDVNNYYYCFSKHYTDQFFVGFYTAQATALAAGGVKNILAGIGSGGIAVTCAASGVMSPMVVPITGVAAKEIAVGLLCEAGAIGSGLLGYHSENVAYASGQNLAKATKPVSSSAKLSGAMQQAGKPKPTYSNYAAHHIVPEHATRAENARKILERCGIKPNDAANGVYLPTKAGQVGAGNATIHSGRHTNAYVDYVTSRLERANPQDYASCKKVLDAIADELLNGTLKLGK